MVKGPIKLAIRDQIALELHPNWKTVGNADPTPGRITSTGRLDRTEYQIGQDGTYDTRLKYAG